MEIFKVRHRGPTPGPITNLLICEAIRKNRLVSCVYVDGDRRTIEPYCHGHSHAGHEILSAYQVSGFSPHGEVHGWKTFDVEKLVVFELLDQPFSGRDDFNPDQPGITQIHCLFQS